MKKMTKILTAVLTAGMTALTAIPFNVYAVEKNSSIVLLGDGVFTGAELPEGERSCAEILDSMTDAEIHNFASDSATTADVLAQLDDSAVQSALSGADVIIVSAGMHDIFDPYIETAKEQLAKFESDYNWHLENITELFYMRPEDLGIDSDMVDALATEYTNPLARAARQNRNSAAENLENIGQKLSAYPNAKVIYVNCFNIMDTLGNISELSAKRQDSYNVVKRPVSSCLNSDKVNVNGAIRNNATNYGSIIIDTFSGFEGMAYEYSCLPILTPNLSSAGHEWIALEILSAIGEDENSKVSETLKVGDANCDGNIDAADAAKLLVHSANNGGGGVGYFGSYAQKIGNITAIGKTPSEGDTDIIDATDAALILQYAALQGSGQNADFAELVKQAG
jgi:hypothetical protein